MTVYEFLVHASQTYSAVVGGGKTEDIMLDLKSRSIRSRKRLILQNGIIVRPAVYLENGEKLELNGLIDFSGDPYAEIERLYAQFKHSVPNRHVRLNKGYFKALSSDSLTMQELTDNMPRPQARLELEGFILLASAAGLIPWHVPEHFFWQSANDPDCIVYREWIMGKEEDAVCRSDHASDRPTAA